jgi:hypothetical protein
MSEAVNILIGNMVDRALGQLALVTDALVTDNAC